MSGTIYDGGPAFPRPESTDGNDYVGNSAGMSLRDWFAGQALAGMRIAPSYEDGPCDTTLVARSYAIADAMLKARMTYQP